METRVDVGDVALSATVSLPDDGPAIGGIVTLHGASRPDRDYFLYEHLADVACRRGWAVLRYDRRPWERGTIPFDIQAADASAALAHLRELVDLDGRPTGFWGVSQGAWVATVAAADGSDTAFVILVGYSGWTPGAQMRYVTANFLRRDGYDREDVADLLSLRAALESFLRGETPRNEAQRYIDRMRKRPWFDLAYVPGELPPLESIAFPGLLDFDPTEPLSETDCPLLAIWGAEDMEVPPDESRDIVLETRSGLGAATSVEVLDGVGHVLTAGEEEDVRALHPDYGMIVADWLDEQWARWRSRSA